MSNLAIKHHVPPVITFDQPLYWKAAEIIRASPENSRLKEIVLMLGTFHTLMNLLGAIGTLMDGTGLKTTLEVVYGETAVVHIMTGKSVQRAIRSHLLVDKCLHQIIVKSVVDDIPEFATIVNEAEKMYSSLLKCNITLEDFVESNTVAKINKELDKKRSYLNARSKTSQLLLSYQQMIRIARALIIVDRTGSWESHLCAVSDALSIFAAAGHFNYLKSAYFYIQEMSKLESRHPDVYKKFHDGFHVIRRTNQYWAGSFNNGVSVFGDTAIKEIQMLQNEKGRSGDGAKAKVKWPFCEMLMFLNDHTAEGNE
ncbi:hypothetical protein HOLleu_10852 [Holothuria leucospilota]|uniref:Uncharacterized protein n=1 Tax=Holothuria leucospilota TaxID=206669 RepID=A0A9Q1CEJ6_HOLLE|nr:hypothetical protein HOLleu_10852 [Holothuria leucospilota]